MDCNFSVWDNPRQCHGDADGIKQGFYWVSTIDLAILRAVYTYPGGDWPAIWPGSINYDPHADFDRNFRVDNFDADIIEQWFGQLDVPGDCGKKLAFESPGPQCLLSNTFYTIRWVWRIYTEYIPLSGDEDYPGTFSLYYSTNTGQNWTYIATVSSATSYDWSVPQVDSNNCMLKIVDDEHNGLTDTSGTFRIHQCQTSIEGDVNGDCYVNFKDFAIIGAYWFAEGGTDMNDLMQLAQGWCRCGNPCDSNCIEQQ